MPVGLVVIILISTDITLLQDRRRSIQAGKAHMKREGEFLDVFGWSLFVLIAAVMVGQKKKNPNKNHSI